MYQDVNFNTFHDAFKSIRPENFTYEGLRALYDYLIEYENDTNTPLELDVIAFCCEFSEYTQEEFQDAYIHLNKSARDELICVKFGTGVSASADSLICRGG